MKFSRRPVLFFVAASFLSAPGVVAETPGPGGVAAPVASDLGVAWFIHAMTGEAPAPVAGEKSLASGGVAAKQRELWGRYKTAAIQLGWDKDLLSPESPVLPKKNGVTRAASLKLRSAMLPCGAEKMPYVYLYRGEKPAAGRPLYFQLHGGGSTDMKLAGPHAWPANTRDWNAQVGLFFKVLPEGLYFIPRMANDNKGRWWMGHNRTAFDLVMRRAVLFNEVDPDRIYMMGISEGAYGTEALTPFWGDRLAGGCAMAGGAGGGERFYNLRNTAFRNDTGENDTMYGRIGLARQTHAFLDRLKQADPAGYDHALNIQAGRGHGVDYAPGPAWLSTKRRDNRPAKICWFNFELDGERRTDFAWLSLEKAPAHDALFVAEADRATNTVTVSALANPPGVADEKPVYATSTPEPVAGRIPYTGNTLTLHLDDKLLDLDKPVTVVLNGKKVFAGRVERLASNLAGDIVRTGDPGRVFPARVKLAL